MREALGIAAEIQATRLRFPRHVARHDRVMAAPVWRPVEPKVVVARADSPPQRKAADVMAKFCAVYSDNCEKPLTVADLVSPCRKRQQSHARHVCFKLVREITGMSTTQVGRMFRRDHTTILHGLLHAADHMAADPALKAAHDAVTAYFQTAAAAHPPAATQAAVVDPTPTAAAGHLRKADQ